MFGVKVLCDIIIKLTILEVNLVKSEIIEENKILRNKKHLIANEINIKKESLGNIEIKRKELLKKTGYDVR